MFKAERQEEILKILHDKQHATVEYLARQLYASAATIRRDLSLMEEMGLVKKSYGGVSLAGVASQETAPFDVRDQEHHAEKVGLARRAAAMVHDGDTLIMDSSSTVLRMVPYLSALKNITVITNSLKVTEELSRQHVRVYCTGGQCSEDAATFGGGIAESALRSFHADLLFFSSRGVSGKGMISDSSDINNQIRKVMLRQSDRRIFLCDSSKIGHSYLFNLCHVSEVETVLCDQPLPEAWYY